MSFQIMTKSRFFISVCIGHVNAVALSQYREALIVMINCSRVIETSRQIFLRLV